jgi:uncharacterized membrane protein YphA (DoxX/SURF4 family)
MKAMSLIGRILYALPIGLMGVNHFLMSSLFAKKLDVSIIPNQAFVIIISGLMLITVSICIMLNKYVEIACLWLAGLMLLIITTIHLPGLFNPELGQISYFELLQDTSIMGGAVMIAAFIYQKKKCCENKIDHLEDPSI